MTFTTRAEVIQWLMENPGKELLCPDGYPVRWEEGDGPQVKWDGCWERTSLDYSDYSGFRIPFAPRRFGPWVEVERWEDAENAGPDDAYKVAVLCDGDVTCWGLESVVPADEEVERRWRPGDLSSTTIPVRRAREGE